MVAIWLFVNIIILSNIHSSTNKYDCRNIIKYWLRYSHLWIISPYLLSNWDFNLSFEKNYFLFRHSSRLRTSTLSYLQVVLQFYYIITLFLCNSIKLLLYLNIMFLIKFILLKYVIICFIKLCYYNKNC